MSTTHEKPFALFLTWTTYGSWLPGDERGYVSNTLQPDETYRKKENRLGVPYEKNDLKTHAQAEKLLKAKPVFLSKSQADIAAEEIAHAAVKRHWMVLRAAIMSNHVHILVTNCPDDAPEVLRILKGRSQAALSRFAGKPQRWWTKRGSQRYLHDEQAIDSVIRYIEQQKSILAFVCENVRDATKNRA